MLRSPAVKTGRFTPTHFFSAAPGSTLIKPDVLDTAKFAREVGHRETPRGTHILEGLRIFRTGTFTDMFGQTATWEDYHLQLMVAHYQILKDGGYFPNVPIREDHTSSLAKVAGYFENVYLDSEDPSFLSSDVEFTEPQAYDKWYRGTWRARSVEIGMFETNDGKFFWPVVMGLAFVDIPAVEGLYRSGMRPEKGYSQQVINDMEEGSVPPDINTDPEGWIKAVNYAAWLQAVNYAKACEDWERAVVYAAALEAEHPTPGIVPGIAPHGAGQPDPAPNPAPPAPAPTPSPQPAPAPPPTQPTAQFRVGGQVTNDFRAVQAHIDTLEQTIAETVHLGRTEFVAGLARDNKIAASQIESLTAHALSLSPEQFASFRVGFEAAPASSLFGQHGQQPAGTPSNPGTPVPSAESDLEVAKGIVRQHRNAGMAPDSLKKLPSYQKLVKAGIEQA